MKKAELQLILSQHLLNTFKDYQFVLVKSQNKLIRVIEGGAHIIEYRVNESFDEISNQLIFELEILVYIRFDIIHDWFLPYEFRKKSDLKFNWTWGEYIKNLGLENLKIDMPDKYIEDSIVEYVGKSKNIIDTFFSHYSSLSNLAQKILTLNEEKRAFNIRTAIENLTIIWIFDRDKFIDESNKYYIKLKKLNDIGDPMVGMYLPKYEDILNSLMKYDYSGSIQNLKFN